MELPLEIVFVTPGFPSDESDTTCLPALQDFVLEWKESFPETKISVVTIQYPGWSGTYDWNGVKVYSAGGKMRTGISKIITWLKVFRELFRRRGKNQVILSYFLTEATLVSQWFSRLFHVPHIAMAAGQDVMASNRYLNIINISSLKIAVFNDKMSDELRKTSGRGADYIIPMGIGRHLVENFVALKEKPERDIDILIVGSLIPLKQVDIAIHLIGRLKKDFPGIRCVIIGIGTQSERLNDLVKELDLQNQITFTGELKREEVFGKMQRSKILLHTSRYEGQSTVISEALAFGMTVVCFDVGRVFNHEKIIVCDTEENMNTALTHLLKANAFDFSPVIPVTMQENVRSYEKILRTVMSVGNAN